MNARALHRRLAWIAAAAALAWALTGFLHPIMSWTAPRAAVQAPPAAPINLSGVGPPLAAALAAAGAVEVSHVRLVEVAGEPVWLAAIPGRPDRLAVNALSGEPAAGAEAAHAARLARHYANLPDTEIVSARPVDTFSTRYPSINRLLPVWEVRFATPDGLTIYVDTGMDRLASVTNTPRRVMLSVFQHVHTLKFLEGAEPLRLAILALLVGSVLAMTLLGLIMLLKARGRGLRRIHTLAAWVALPVTLMFTVSGLLHLFVTTPLRAAPLPQSPVFSVNGLPAPDLPTGPINFVTASAGPDGLPVWRIEAAGGVAYSGRPAGFGDRDRAREIAGAPPEAQTDAVTRFGPEYGFAEKRLPVIRVETKAGPVFVDVREGLVAAAPRYSALEAVESWSFDMLHKWEFLRPFGRIPRDLATMAATLIILLTAGLGISLALRSRRRRSVS